MFKLIKNFYQNIKCKGFALLETSLAVAIMGTMVCLFMPSMLNLNFSYKRQITNKHMEQIFTALGNYIVLHRKLPCPVQNIEDESSTPCHTNKGFIPYKTIGIEKATTLNGFKKPIIYVINSGLSQNIESTFSQQHSVHTASHNIHVLNENNNPVITAQTTHNIIAVLLLSTENSHNKPHKSAKELVNLDDSNTFYQIPYSKTFRQIVRYCTYGHLFNYYGKTAPVKYGNKSPKTRGHQGFR